MKSMQSTCKALLVLIAIALVAIVAYGNGGPFVVKYPHGDPSAKGVFARMAYTLHPARETRLRVVKEDLNFRFMPESNLFSSSMPLVTVIASYTIENPTSKEVSVDFGFPILRGIYMGGAMSPTPDVKITVDGKSVRSEIISNSAIYGIIRQLARNSIEEGIKRDSALALLVAAVRKASSIAQSSKSETNLISAYPTLEPLDRSNGSSFVDFGSSKIATSVKNAKTYKPGKVHMPNPKADYEAARAKLRSYLVDKKHWNDRDAALFVEYPGLDYGDVRSFPHDRWMSHGISVLLMHANLGPLSAIGEQKATQYFVQIASHFDKDAAATYESIFADWGGDVRDRSVDLESGKVRLREIDIKDSKNENIRELAYKDPTIYARVDYLDPNAKINKTEKAACQAILKSLSVVFTFAPMNLLRYQVTFPPRATQNVTVAYKQYAYLDTHGVPSYQLAYVLHPASLWDDFGPIHVRVQTPKGVASCWASVPIVPGLEVPPDNAFVPPEDMNIIFARAVRKPTYPLLQYEARLETSKEKTGELFMAVSKAEWDRFYKAQLPERTTK